MRNKKKHDSKRYLLIIGTAICITVFLFSVYNVIMIIKDYRESDKFYEKTVSEYEIPNQDRENKEDEKDRLPQIDFKSLLEKNEDVVGWIYIDGTDINYPILKGSDNSQYLFQSYYKKYLTAGSIFMDYRCDESFDEYNTVIYGHNMKNGAMFGKLKKYKKESFLEEHPYVYIMKPDGSVNKYEVFAAYEADIDGVTYELPSKKKKNYNKLLKLIAKKNILEKDGKSTITDSESLLESKPKLLTLSTCTEDSSDTSRYVVICRLEETGEQTETGEQIETE